MMVTRWMQRLHLDWPRTLLAMCAMFHVATGLVLSLAPLQVVLTEGTRPVLQIASRDFWSVVFITIGVSVALLWRQRPLWMRAAVLAAVLLLGGMWLTAFALAVLKGQGSAVGVVVWPFLYLPWLVAIHRLGKR